MDGWKAATILGALLLTALSWEMIQRFELMRSNEQSIVELRSRLDALQAQHEQPPYGHAFPSQDARPSSR